ncbi:GMC family oxidoreductase [Streptomyces sp. NPDC090306]|uniref:GMC family oxidoreductase n=1 Tax=Streptomyces sp. NPDC090306 TaxID=3365961 RepID=UPI003828D10E
MKKLLNTDFQYIVVGAGSAGTVAASLLASRTGQRVLLIEAGPDYEPHEVPAELRDGRTPALGSHDWGYRAVQSPGRRVWLPRGRVVGGCSAVNTCIALRPEPDDFDGWSPAGGLWSWPEVLQTFVAVERDFDFDGAAHGDRGPVPVRRVKDDVITAASAAFVEACAGAGFAVADDLNAPGSVGVGRLPLNVDEKLNRVSTAAAFLEPVRGLPNLTVLPDALVDSVAFSGSRAVGVNVIARGRREFVAGDEVILSAGAVGTAAVLQRSGIGPADQLRRIGVAVVADSPGVGIGLADHCQVPIICEPEPGALDLAAGCAQVALRCSTDASTVANDMQICLLNHVDLQFYAPTVAKRSGSRHAFVVTANLMAPESRGRVAITSADPAAPPTIQLVHHDSAHDRQRLRSGVRFARELVHSAAFDRLRRRCLDRGASKSASDLEIDGYIDEMSQTAHHPTGTAKLAAPEAGGVVDAECKVYGTERLRVADASIIPGTVRANTNLTSMMIGAHLVRILLGRDAGGLV